MSNRPKPRAAVCWSADAFRAGDASEEPLDNPVDITGRMRALVVGPMAPLGGGRWRLTVRFSLDEDAAGHPYILQFIHGDSLVEQHFQPAGAGEYAISLDNSYPHPGLIALRLWVAEPAFDGKLFFQGAEAQPLDD
ncbi:MAG TPA: hypothetical protein VFN88_09080 [Caulobacteraceae bacterium]|nr:hypothetical protein [Caulobacteraceae bacterium]